MTGELMNRELTGPLIGGIEARGLEVAAGLKQIGYAHVTLDLQGYRRGNLNEQTRLRGREPT